MAMYSTHMAAEALEIQQLAAPPAYRLQFRSFAGLTYPFRGRPAQSESGL
jgi:hypothetical protein